MKLIRLSIIVLSLTSLLFTSCNKATPPVELIIDAGPTQTIQLPIDSVTLGGIITSGETANMNFAWISLSGPNIPIFINSNGSVTVVDSLIAGTYVFEVEVTNSNGLSAVDTVSVIVRPVVTVDAGQNHTIQLPLDTVTLSGIVKTGQTPNMVYSWSVLSGPSVPVIANSSSLSPFISNLVAGKYVFQFQATNSSGLTGIDTTSVIVLPADAVIKTLVLQPANNPNEAHADTYTGTGGAGDTEIPISAWTVYGTPQTHREFIKFDFSGIPAGATIDAATLYLYEMPVPHGGNDVDDNYGDANEYYVERITADWSPASLSWANQPAATNANSVLVPQSTASLENDVINVTGLVNDMQVSGNYGFLFKLQNEVYYNIRQYASSYYSDSTLHPKLVITYH